MHVKLRCYSAWRQEVLSHSGVLVVVVMMMS